MVVTADRPRDRKQKSQRVVGHFFFGFDFLVRNFEGFDLPRSPPRGVYGKTGALPNLVLKQARFGVEGSVSDLAAIISTHGELLVACVAPSAFDILPADLLFASQPRTRPNAIHLDGQNWRVNTTHFSKFVRF
jgi:hypothetical protein